MDFSQVGIGTVTPDDGKRLISISLSKGETIGNNTYINVAYNPNDATYKQLEWSIIAGNEYATVSNGVVVALEGADGDNVTVKAVSKKDVSIFDTLTLAVTYVSVYDAEVEYLETDGVAYIDTGINTTSDTSFNTSIYLPVEPTNASLFPFGARKVQQSNTMEWFRSKDRHQWQWRFGNKLISKTYGSEATEGLFVIKNDVNPNEVTFAGITLTAEFNTFDTERNFFIFRLNNDGTPRDSQTGIRIYSFKLYSGARLVRDYIPVRKDGVGYLYDLVSGELFGNAAESGVFTYGNDKN